MKMTSTLDGPNMLEMDEKVVLKTEGGGRPLKPPLDICRFRQPKDKSL